MAHTMGRAPAQASGGTRSGLMHRQQCKGFMRAVCVMGDFGKEGFLRLDVERCPGST